MVKCSVALSMYFLRAGSHDCCFDQLPNGRPRVSSSLVVPVALSSGVRCLMNPANIPHVEASSGAHFSNSCDSHFLLGLACQCYLFYELAPH
jgi:hypothetical protein